MRTQHGQRRQHVEELSTQVMLEALLLKFHDLSADEAGAILEVARCGNAPAQYIVATALETAEPPLLAESREWFSRAAERQYEPAIKKLQSLAQA